jgi:hypothetical protein
MNELELHSFSNEAITSKEIKFALQNGLWINATATAKEFGKDLENYWRLASTKSYVDKLAELSSVENTDLKKIIVGKGKPQGTYLHPELVVHFARWLDDGFAIECDRFIKSEMIKVNNIKTEALLEQAEKEKQRAVTLAKKCKIYDDGTMSVRGVIQHSNLDVSEDFVWEALTWKGWNEDITRVTKYRRLPVGTPSYIGTDRGSQSSTYYPQVVKQAVIDYINSQDEE